MKVIYNILLIVCVLLNSCKNESPKEIYLKSRNNIVNVHDNIIEIPMEETPISSYANIYSMGDYYILNDYKSAEALIYIFNKTDFKCVANATPLGQGPQEIANIGEIIPNEKAGKFFVFDHGKQKLLSYDLDSLVSNPSTYKFQTKAKFEKQLYPDRCCYINDTLVMSAITQVYEDNRYGELAGIWNMKTGEIQIGYENPKIEKRRFSYDASEEAGIYVKCYSRYDLVTICNLDGSLRCNIYGPEWDEDITNTCHYNMDVRIGRDKIYALYSGEDHRTRERYPSKIVIFDCNGNYLKTLNTGYHILHFCYDKEYHRLILYTYDEMQFGYLELKGII